MLIDIQDLTLTLPHKICFENFSTKVYYGDKIAIIGDNGSGKSSLMKIINGDLKSFDGEVNVSSNVTFGYVPQIVENFNQLSGAQRFNKALSYTLGLKPDILLLDEPTNHLDIHNKKSLIHALKNYLGTLIVITHDTTLIKECTNIIWDIKNSSINKFSGKYDDYIAQNQLDINLAYEKLASLEKEKKNIHKKLMDEQNRSARSKKIGKKNIINKKRSNAEAKIIVMRAQSNQGKKIKDINESKDEIVKKIKDNKPMDIIIPKFSISASDISDTALIQIVDGSVGYEKDKYILTDINLSVYSKTKLAIVGKNGSGKSTLIKAILNEEGIYKSGSWYSIKTKEIGYLDQHYNNLDHNLSVYENVLKLAPHLTKVEIRRHLNDFLFNKDEEVDAATRSLSGGEKARASLALIAIKTPKLLILDEITNNLDIKTKEHVKQVLKLYPGAMMVISHDEEFLEDIEINEYYQIK